jgi:hypothetical protein
MSLNGQTQTYMPPTLDGLNIVEADQIYVDGVELDPANLVPYTGANKTLNMGSQAIKTSYAPVVDADVVNLLTLQNAITYIDNINVANFVKYTGSNQNVDLGSNNLTVGNAGLTSFSNIIRTELNNVLAGYTPASITVGNNFGTITNAAGVYQATSNATFASLVLGAPPSGEKYSVSLSLKSVDVNNNTNLYLYGSTTPNLTGGTGMILSFSIPPNTTGFTVFTNTITFPVGSTYLLLVYNSQKSGGIDTLYWNAFTMTGVGSVVKNLIAPSTGLDATNKTYVDTQDALRVPYTGATSNVILTGSYQFQQAYNATTSDTTTVVNRQTLDAAIASSSGSFPFTGTTNINGGLQTLQNPMQYNSSLDANNYFVVGVAPTTYIFSTNWIINPVSGTTATISLDSALFYFSTSIKYVITFTGIYGTSASWTGTVFNNTTSTTVSDVPIAITTTSQTLSMTFTPGSNNPTIYLRFVGASGTLRWTNFTIKQVDTEVMGNLLIDSQINSNIVQANGKTVNLANGLKVNQTSVATASSLTTASLPAGVAASTLSGAYTLTATAGGTTFGVWLGSGFTYTAGAKYNYTFTGFSTNATATQAMILYTNTYTGGSGTMIGDYVVNVPITSSTVSGSFTATSNSNVVWNFVGSAAGKSVSFSGFTLTRADTEINGVITATGIATDTPTTTIGLNSSNQLIKYANPVGVFTGSVGAGYVPYASSANVFANSIISQSGSTANVAGTVATNNGSYVSAYPSLNSGAGSNLTLTAGNGAFGSLECYDTANTNKLPLVLQGYGGNVGIGEFSPVANFQVRGTASICGGTNYANTQGYMASGSLTLGATNKNYGGGGAWSGNTAGLLMECLDNTEFAVHDAGYTVASFMYYSGNRFYMGRDMGFGSGTTPIQTNGLLSVGGYSATAWTKFQVLGTAASISGGHVAYYTTSDVYPLYHQLNYTHDNIFTGYDLYYDGTFRTSLNGTGFCFYKSGNAFNLLYANGTQGGGVSMPSAMSVNSSGVISEAQKPFCIVGAVGGASIGYGAGQVIGSLGYLYAYQSASMSNSGTSGWNSSFGRFYFTNTGRWQVNWSFYWNNFAAGSRVVLNRYNSGSGIQESRYCALNGGGIGGDTTQAYSTLFYANAGDFLECGFSSGSGTIYFGGITHTHCTYHFIG